MDNYRYKGFYGRFQTPSKKIAGVLTGADTLVGDEFTLSIKTDSGSSVAWLTNRFGVDIGFFDTDSTRQIQLALAADMTVRAFLSFIAYSESPEPGVYWGEMAVICYAHDPQGVFAGFATHVAARLTEGIRTDLKLTVRDIEQLEIDPSWLPQGTIFLPETSKGSAIIKSKRLASEKIVEQGRKGNIGCYVGTVAFFIIVVLVVLIALHSCGLIG